MKIASEQEIFFVPLSSLVRSENNVRTINPDKKKDQELIASIKEHGILHNLVVSENEGGTFSVEAGGRRFAALQLILEEGLITGDYQVPVKIVPKSDAVAVSIAESIRAELHPADEFRAYKKLQDDGKSIKQIAEAYGKSTNQVKKLLKLGSVEPLIIDAYKAGKMTLEAIMAFTVNDDHEKQLAAFEECKPHFWPGEIRSVLTNKAIESDSPLVKFVGLNEYKKAGGKTSSDLFNSTTYLYDRQLLNDLANKKLEGIADELRKEGWQNVITLTSRPAYGDYVEIESEPVKAPKKLMEEYTKEKEKMEKLEDPENWDDDAYEEQLEKVEALETKINNYRKYTDKDKKELSALVFIQSFDGAPEIKLGVLSRQEYAERQKERQSETSDNSQYNQTFAGGNYVMSQAIESRPLIEEMGEIFCLKLQKELMEDSSLCFDLLVFTLANSLMIDRINTSPAKINITKKTYASEKQKIEADERFQNMLTVLESSWKKHHHTGEQFEAFRKIPRLEKSRWLAFIVSQSIDVSLTRYCENHEAGTILNDLRFNLYDHWQPTAENYFTKLKKPDLLAIGEQLEASFSDHNKNKPKSFLVDAVEERARAHRWIPESFANAIGEEHSEYREKQTEVFNDFGSPVIEDLEP